MQSGRLKEVPIISSSLLEDISRTYIGKNQGWIYRRYYQKSYIKQHKIHKFEVEGRWITTTGCMFLGLEQWSTCLLMIGIHVIGSVLFSAIYAETDHAVGACEVVAVSAFLHNLMAIWTHLYVLSLCTRGIQILHMLSTWNSFMPFVHSLYAELKVALWASYLEISSWYFKESWALWPRTIY